LIRYPNVYVSLAATINLIVRAPRQFAEILGKLLFWAGEDKIVFGSEAPIFHPRWAVEAFWNFELPEELVTQHLGAPLTERAKRKILGENLLRLHGMDLADVAPSASPGR
jgi:predicted TIM-barrel fold metal-dependent hydrolase